VERAGELWSVGLRDAEAVRKGDVPTCARHEAVSRVTPEVITSWEEPERSLRGRNGTRSDPRGRARASDRVR
jgi:hypothetical protein